MLRAECPARFRAAKRLLGEKKPDVHYKLNGRSLAPYQAEACFLTRRLVKMHVCMQVAELDVASLQSINNFASQWGHRQLHVLVNNAGLFNLQGLAFPAWISRMLCKLCNICLAGLLILSVPARLHPKGIMLLAHSATNGR